LLLLGFFKGKAKPEEASASMARKAPCPCGSGRKYKRYCGKS
jgi:uncharacterized protein YecA (UPF0149 family)